jgi:hypothetical protein
MKQFRNIKNALIVFPDAGYKGNGVTFSCTFYVSLWSLRLKVARQLDNREIHNCRLSGEQLKALRKIYQCRVTDGILLWEANSGLSKRNAFVCTMVQWESVHQNCSFFPQNRKRVSIATKKCNAYS